jgi:predicted ABC-type ATPase
MFAGPNGSGKSTLIDQIAQSYSLGYFVNADVIEKEFRSKKFIDCSILLPKSVSNEDWLSFIKKMNDKRIQQSILTNVKIIDDIMVCDKEIDSYSASVIAEFFRYKLLYSDDSFSFETVMSHPSKLDFLKLAKEQGFKTYLYFICTQDPKINETRVSNRVKKGGHPVDVSKIEKRYFNSLQLLFDAFVLVDRAFIIDSSTDEIHRVFVEKVNEDIKVYGSEIPQWINDYLITNF